MEGIGPVEYAVVAFPGNAFRGEIAPTLADRVETGATRLIDVAFVGKSESGVWARSVVQAMRDAGGVLVALGRIPHDIVQAAPEYVVAAAAEEGGS